MQEPLSRSGDTRVAQHRPRTVLLAVAMLAGIPCGPFASARAGSLSFGTEALSHDTTHGPMSIAATDLNHDGKPELFEYFDPSGKIRRREHMYDDTGAVSQIETYENGKLIRRDLDSRGQHRIDTIDHFDPVTGKRIKRERDDNGDGKVDQWWSFHDDRIEIAMDKNSDGKPDPEATVVLGPGGSVYDAGPPEGGPLATSGEGGTAPPPPPPPVLFADVPDGGAKKDAGAKPGAKK